MNVNDIEHGRRDGLTEEQAEEIKKARPMSFEEVEKIVFDKYGIKKEQLNEDELIIPEVIYKNDRLDGLTPEQAKTIDRIVRDKVPASNEEVKGVDEEEMIMMLLPLAVQLKRRDSKKIAIEKKKLDEQGKMTPEVKAMIESMERGSNEREER